MDLENYEKVLREKFEEIYTVGWTSGWKNGALNFCNIILDKISKGDSLSSLEEFINTFMGENTDEQNGNIEGTKEN